MEAFAKKVVTVVVLVMALVLVASAAGDLCNMSEEGFKACEPSVTGRSPVAPSASCCSALSNADLKCLCSYESLLKLYNVDPNLALELPVKCNLGDTFHCI